MKREDIKYWYLKNHKLFEHLSDSDVDALCVMSSFKQGDKNDIIYFSDADKKRLYTIKHCILKICHQDKDGKEVITELLTEHDIFGYISLSESEKNTNEQYAIVLSDKLSICSFEVEKFKAVLQNNSDQFFIFLTKTFIRKSHLFFCKIDLFFCHILCIHILHDV